MNMARRNITPEEMAAAMAQPGQPYLTADGYYVIPQTSQGGSAEQGLTTELHGFGLYEPGNMDIGDSYGAYTKDGTYQGENTFKKESDNWDMLALALAAGAGMHFLLPGAAGAAAAGGAGGAGVTGAAFGDAGLMYAGADAAAAGTLGGGAAGAGGASALTSAAELMGPTFNPGGVPWGETIPGLEQFATPYVPGPMGPQLPPTGQGPTLPGLESYQVPPVPGSPNSPGAPGSPNVPPVPPGSNSLLDKLPGMDKVIPLAAGAATLFDKGGSGGGGAGGNTAQRMDPRMDQFVYGNLMPSVQGLLQLQAPVVQDQSDRLRAKGRGLLEAPIAPNGFGLLARR